MIRKTLYVLSCLFLIACLLLVSVPASAAANPKYGTITVGTVDAAVGDTVIVPVRIENNPGIMAITISITYDKEALSYVSYDRGDYLKDYTVADHADKGLVRFVNCENKDRKAWKCRFCENVVVDDNPPETCPNEDCKRTNSYDNNAIMVSFHFRVKETASFDLHPITVDYKVGDFANWKLEKLEPVIVSGGVNVAFNGSNCKHQKYGAWETVSSPGCTSTGKKQRNCQKCGHVEIADIPAVGHSYEETWTIDRPATKDQSGVMTRHCIRCDAYTDLLTFSLEQSEEEKIKNQENAEVSKGKFVEELIKEQIPDYEEQTQKQTNTGSKKSQTDQNTNKNGTSSQKSGASSKSAGSTKNTADSPSKTTDPTQKTKNNSSKTIEKSSAKSESADGSANANSSAASSQISDHTITSSAGSTTDTDNSSKITDGDNKNAKTDQGKNTDAKDSQNTTDPNAEDGTETESILSPSEELLALLPDAKQFFFRAVGLLFLLLRLLLF